MRLGCRHAGAEVASRYRVRNRTDMFRWPKFLGVALLPVGLLLFGPAPHAATSSTVDILSDDAATDVRDNVDIGAKPPANREKGKPLQSGNPLWSVPLSVLTA